MGAIYCIYCHLFSSFFITVSWLFCYSLVNLFFPVRINWTEGDCKLLVADQSIKISPPSNCYPCHMYMSCIHHIACRLDRYELNRHVFPAKGVIMRLISYEGYSCFTTKYYLQDENINFRQGGFCSFTQWECPEMRGLPLCQETVSAIDPRKCWSLQPLLPDRGSIHRQSHCWFLAFASSQSYSMV